MAGGHWGMTKPSTKTVVPSTLSSRHRLISRYSSDSYRARAAALLSKRRTIVTSGGSPQPLRIHGQRRGRLRRTHGCSGWRVLPVLLAVRDTEVADDVSAHSELLSFSGASRTTVAIAYVTNRAGDIHECAQTRVTRPPPSPRPRPRQRGRARAGDPRHRPGRTEVWYPKATSTTCASVVVRTREA